MFFLIFKPLLEVKVWNEFGFLRKIAFECQKCLQIVKRWMIHSAVSNNRRFLLIFPYQIVSLIPPQSRKYSLSIVHNDWLIIMSSDKTGLLRWDAQYHFQQANIFSTHFSVKLINEHVFFHLITENTKSLLVVEWTFYYAYPGRDVGIILKASRVDRNVNSVQMTGWYYHHTSLVQRVMNVVLKPRLFLFVSAAASTNQRQCLGLR